MPESGRWSAQLTGDPLRPGPEADSLATLGEAIAPGGAPANIVYSTHDTAVAVALGAPGSRLGWRWVDWPDARSIELNGPAVASLVWITSPFAQSGQALRLAARALAWVADPERVAATRAAPTREALVRLLAPFEETLGEVTLMPEDVLTLLGSGWPGLVPAEVVRRRALTGVNRLERQRRRPIWLRLLEQFWSFFAILLWIGGALAIFAGMPQLGLAIFVVIVINGVFSFLQEYRAERALEALERLLPYALTVVRAGVEASCPALDLVPGDVVLLGEGDQVPADGHVIASDGLRLEQGSLTGEPQPIFKLPATARALTHARAEEHAERVFAGTSVMSGAGRMVVTATGMSTEIGGIAHLTQTVGEELSPLQREMLRVTRVVTVLAVGLGVLFFALGVGTGRIGAHAGLLFALGVIVANVPEGLLPTLTLALALGVQRMARERSVIRRLSAVETLGAVQVICTDKTGTLTENRMTVRVAWTADGEREFAAADSSGGANPGRAPQRAADTPRERVRGTAAPEADAALGALIAAAVLASVATHDHGDPTERALVDAATRLGLDVDALRAGAPVLAPLPFDSFRKRMTLVRAASDGSNGRPVAWVKGAPREMLGHCTRIAAAGTSRALGEDEARALLAVHDRMAREGLRLLAVARREVDPAEVRAAAGVVERDLTLLGLVALWDPPRSDVAEAVALCRRAGIHVVIVTGDYGLTASALAARIGLPITQIVTGDEVDRLGPETLRELALTPGVLFARVSPAHKLAVVRALRAADVVVAVTGDGVNDAPALRAADIGVAMGLRGSEVAKEAAEMVITDDHFASIVSAVRLGRSIWSNVGRFVTYVFASNVAELVPFLALVFVGVPLPLTVMQVLAVDLGTDLLPALALGAEPPESGLMDRPPRARTERLLSLRRLAHAYGFLGVIEAALAMFAFFATYWMEGWRPGEPMASSGALYIRATTMTFAGIVAGQVGNVFACRTEFESVFRVGFTGNRLLLWSVVAEIAILVAVIYIPPLAAVFGTAPLRLHEGLLLLAFPPILLLAEEARKWLMRRASIRR